MDKKIKVSPKRVKWSLIPYKFVDLNVAFDAHFRALKMGLKSTLSYRSPRLSVSRDAEDSDLCYKDDVESTSPKGIMTSE